MKEATITLYSEKESLPFVINDNSDNHSLFDYLIEQIKRSLCGDVVEDNRVFFQPIHENHINNLERLKKYLEKEIPELKLPKLNAIAPWLRKVEDE